MGESLLMICWLVLLVAKVVPRALTVAPTPPQVHWTTYVQTFAVIASTIGTFVYVWFTYHIMTWAVGQGKASVELSEVSVEELRRRLAVVDISVGNALIADLARLERIMVQLEKGSGDDLPLVVERAEEELREILRNWEIRSTEPMAINVRQLLSVPAMALGTVVLVMNAQLFDEGIDEPSVRRDRLVPVLRATCALLLKLVKDEYHLDLSSTILGEILGDASPST